MATQHTPGPWKVGFNGYSVVASEGPQIATLQVEFAPTFERHLNVGEWRREQGANARLMAAAPDMLAALERIAPALLDAGKVITAGDLQAVVVAIKKAKGEQVLSPA